MIELCLVTIAILLIGILLIAGFKITHGPQLPTTILYEPTFRLVLIGLSGAILLSVMVYVLSGSLELTVIFGAFLLSCVSVGTVLSLLFEYKTRARRSPTQDGARK